MLTAFFRGDERHARRARRGVRILAGILIAQCVTAKLMNYWYGLAARTYTHAAEHSLWYLYVVLGGLVAVAFIDVFVIARFSTKYGRLFALWWRGALMENFILRWRHTTHHVEGASQRLQEDLRRLPDCFESVGMGAIRSVLFFFLFGFQLFWMSDYFHTGPFAWLGSLMVVVFGLNVIGGAISVWLGRHLPEQVQANEANEARLRERLVFAEHDRSYLDTDGGWRRDWDLVESGYTTYYDHLTGFVVWVQGFDKIMMAAPYVMCLTALFTGDITYAIMGQIVDAFGRVNGSFSYLVNNASVLIDLYAAFKRLCGFDRTLPADIPPASADVVPLYALEDNRARA